MISLMSVTVPKKNFLLSVTVAGAVKKLPGVPCLQSPGGALSASDRGHSPRNDSRLLLQRRRKLRIAALQRVNRLGHAAKKRDSDWRAFARRS